MAIKKFSVVIAVDSSGDGTGSIANLSGKLEAIAYTFTDYAATMDIDVQAPFNEAWDEDNIAAASTIRYPRVLTHDGLGVSSLYAAGGEAVETRIVLSDDTIDFIVADAGASKTGTFTIYIDDEG